MLTVHESNFYTSHQSAKVDYLLEGNSGFYFVELLTVTVDDEKRYIDVIFVRLVDEEVLKHQGQGQGQEQQEQQGWKGVEGILIKCLKTEEE